MPGLANTLTVSEYIQQWHNTTEHLMPNYQWASSPTGGGINISPYEKKPKMQPKRANKLYNYPIYDLWNRFIKKQDGEIGLEIECEGMNLFDAPIQWWVTHQDGSLRAKDGHPPIEYVLSKPISRHDVPKALRYLSSKLKAAGSQIDESPRTSVHVHINCQQLCMKQALQFIGLYMIFEDLLVEWSGPDRVGNLFCLRAKDAEYNVHLLEEAFRTEDFNALCADEVRYMSCNMSALRKFGSLEFRSMKGTVDETQIQQWVDILLHIKDKSQKFNSPSEIVDVFMKLGPHGFYEMIFREKPWMFDLFCYHPELSKCLWDGLRLFRDVALSQKWEVFDPDKEPKKSIMKDKKAIEYPDELGPDEIWHDPNNPGVYYRGHGSYDTAMNYYFVVNTTDVAVEVPRLRTEGLTTLVSARRKHLMMYNGQIHAANMNIMQGDEIEAENDF